MSTMVRSERQSHRPEEVVSSNPNPQARPVILRQKSTTALNVSKPPRALIRAKSTSAYDKQQNALTNRMSASMMEELLECKVCNKRLQHPKMLSCQHTFCLACLQGLLNSTSEAVDCPNCSQQTYLRTAGRGGILDLPSNLYLDSLLTSLQQESTSGAGDHSCSKCKTVCSASACQHCLQAFCTVCWPHHITELQSQLPSLLDQLRGAKDKLHHRIQDFRDTCKRLKEHINVAVEVRIQSLRAEQENLKEKSNELLKKGELSVESLLERITDAEQTVSKGSFDAISENKKKVALFLQLHRTTSAILEEVSNWGEPRPTFDAENFRIDTAEESKTGSEVEDAEEIFSEDLVRNIAQVSSPDGLSNHYRVRSFMPRVSLGRSVLHRPAGVGVAPWDDGVNMYIAGTDGRHVLVIDRNRMKLVHQLSTPDMLYPHGIAFSKHLHEVYVTGSTSLHVVIYQVVPQNLKVHQNLCSETLF